MHDGKPKVTFGQWIDRLTSNRWLVLALAVSGVISTPLAIYLYVKQLPSRQLFVEESPVRSVFVSKDTPSVLEVRTKDQTVRGKDVFAVQLAIWNGGNQSIRPEHVLEPIVFRPPSGTEILEAKVLRSTRPVCGVDATIDSGREARVHWKILEPNDGAVIQLLLIGEQTTSLPVAGVIESSGRFRYKRPTLEQKERSFAEDVVGGIVVLVLGWFAGPWLLLRGVPQAWRKRKRSFGLVIVLIELVIGICITAVLVLGLWLWARQYRESGVPPSGLFDAPAQHKPQP
jgi:hypothetical protein